MAANRKPSGQIALRVFVLAGLCRLCRKKQIYKRFIIFLRGSGFANWKSMLE
jgi:hypothetical protein